MYGKDSLENKMTLKGVGGEEGLRHEYEGYASQRERGWHFERNFFGKVIGG